jgi:glycerol-3-phosphate acyltransferase PlsY
MYIFAFKAVLVIVIGYLLGSLNTSLIVGKFYGKDVRQHGSGNAGLTNTLRTFGKLAALYVILGDILKGFLSCLIGYYILNDQGEAISNMLGNTGNLGLMIGGTGAVIGHNWPLYFGFKGGKGILTTFAVVMTADPKIGLILLGIFIVVLAVTRYVSLGSIIGAAMFPILSGFFGAGKKGVVFIIFAALIAIMAITRHHANIGRLLKGTESKFGAKKV